MLALSESSLGREVANWMPGRFSIRFFWQQELFCFCFWVGDLLRIQETEKREISAECHIAL